MDLELYGRSSSDEITPVYSSSRPKSSRKHCRKHQRSFARSEEDDVLAFTEEYLLASKKGADNRHSQASSSSAVHAKPVRSEKFPSMNHGDLGRMHSLPISSWPRDEGDTHSIVPLKGGRKHPNGSSRIKWQNPRSKKVAHDRPPRFEREDKGYTISKTKMYAKMRVSDSATWEDFCETND
eukprot:gb/GEZJ01004468.1/.p1 GENE.gb/GEZJ01004468.1/~~gb/GEZJ01004468.1/.p1  ORF type:complete len:181 (-),score=23.23 gb/GEZJ01004468.1/:642-1184(-)